jgi:hypothetical protein
MKIQDTDSHALSWSNHPTLLARSMLLWRKKRQKRHFNSCLHTCLFEHTTARLSSSGEHIDQKINKEGNPEALLKRTML